MNKEGIRKLISERKVILCGQEKKRRDFSYIFDNIIVSAEREISELSDRVREDEILIICDFSENFNEYVREYSLIYQKDYIYAEEIFPWIDEYDCELLDGKQICLWSDPSNENRIVDCLKEETELSDIKIISDIESPNPDVFYIIGYENYSYVEAKEKLEALGLTENQDFISYQKIVDRPSKMLLKTYQASPIDMAACYVPFREAELTLNEVYTCCPGWLDHAALGNMYLDDLNQIWSSNRAKVFRLSMINKTFCFCNWNICPKFSKKNSEKYGRIEGDVKISKVPEFLSVDIDDSCNLKCASCRNEIRVSKGEILKEREYIADKLIESAWLSDTMHLQMAGNGEVLFSPVYRKILYDNVKRKEITLFTNGTLFTEEIWNKIHATYENVRIKISIDAATAETFAKLRRGANWNVMLENLHRVGELRRLGLISYVQWNFVVQRDNYLEMKDFIRLGKECCADRIWFSRIRYWGVNSLEEYFDMSMIDRQENMKPGLKEILADSIFMDPAVDIGEFRKFL